MFSNCSRNRNSTAPRSWFRIRILLSLAAVAAAAVSCAPPLSGPTAAGTKPPLPGRTRSALPPVSATSDGPAGADASVPPLYFFYAIHTHSSDNFLPYSGPSQTTIDQTAADNLAQIIRSMQEVLDRYGVKGSWHVTSSMAKGYCRSAPGNSVFHNLRLAGHEIGAHAHKRSEINPAYLALTQDCGITPTVISGLLVEAAKETGAAAQATLSDAFAQSVALGMTLTTENLAPGGGKNPFDDVCSEFGVGNDMWESAGTLMFPWRPDYEAKNVCAHNPSGAMLLVNNVSIESFLVGGQMPDVLDTASFDQLKSRLDGALAYLAANKPDRPAAWGFVTHIIEYGRGDGTAGPDADAIAALDSFLAYAASLNAQGRLVFVTVGEIADAVAAG